MATSNANGVADVAQFPGRTVTVEMSAAQLGYIRTLLFEDLRESAETLAEQAGEAHTSGGKVIGVDARETFRRCIPPMLLDVIGWETDNMLEEDRWVNRQAREKLSPEYDALSVVDSEGKDR